LALAHQAQATALQQAGVNGLAFAAWAAENELPLDLAFDLRISLPRMMVALKVGTLHAQSIVNEIAHILQRYAAYEQSLLPQGVTQRPPRRAPDWSLDSVKPQWVRFALDRWEARATHGSEARLQRSADGPFATAMAGFLALGTDELSFGELHRLIESHVSWTARAIEAEQYLPEPSTFALVADNGESIFSWHEFHLVLGGGLGVTPTSDGRHQAGEGGERDFFALHAGFGPDKSASTSEQVIKSRWEKDIVRIRKRNVLGLPIQTLHHWPQLRHLLTTAEFTELNSELAMLVNSGFFADPVARKKARPWIQGLLHHPARSTTRQEAAQSLAQDLSRRARRLNTTSVAAATGRIQMVQATARYLTERQLKVSDPAQRLNIVELYRTYRRMLIRGELTLEATVRSWLVEWDRKWGVPFSD
jgi:hypothetical protein